MVRLEEPPTYPSDDEGWDQDEDGIIEVDPELLSWQAKVSAEVEKETREQNPVCEWMSAVQFYSCSNGRNRNPRKEPREVTLLHIKGQTRWYSWDGGDENQKGLPWDERATEILGTEKCQLLLAEGEHTDDHLRKEVQRLLRENGGRF